ncbi:MAG: hypothetical protein SCALA702_21150 [Melioribacteraceae bacterium]|nr:MAG: hypothetical protein SCALA702_21150 [Melioribacteraceae bacterium]
MKKQFLLTLFAALVLIPSLFLSAAELNGVKLTPVTDGYKVQFNLPDYDFKNVNVDGENFVKIEVPGYGVTYNEGIPALPLISFNLALDKNDNIPSFEVKTKNLAKTGLSAKVYPFQAPWEKNKPIADRPFTINRSYYNTDGVANHNFVEISEPFVMGGVKGVTVTIYPFSYNPSANELSVISSAEINITADAPYYDGQFSENYNSYFEKVFVNYEAGSSKAGINYLIITAPEFEAGLESFVTHKEGKGYNVSVVTTTECGTSNSAIKTYIADMYNNALERPEFVLLVGDVNVVPAWTGTGAGSPTTDLNYAQLEGDDYFADLFIGRFSVTNATELANAINKNVYMENYIATFTKQNCFMASVDNYSISEGTHNYVIDNYFVPAGYENTKLYQVTYNATTEDLINTLNEDQIFAIYSGHGAVTYWADGPQLTQDQVEALNNTVYSFVFSFACVTGQFETGECFGETWLRTENGASGFYGSSVNSYWDEDDILEKEIVRGWYEDDMTRITPMMDIGKVGLVNYYGGVVTSGQTLLRYLEMYNLMGDPSLPTVQQIPPDNTPPEPVTDLAVGEATSNSLELFWTAPYDSTIGGVTSYDIRYSTTQIVNEDDFNNAPSIIYGGNSDSAGVAKDFLVEELEMGTEYWFAIKAMDVWNNASEMSNVVNGVTYGAPLIDVNPTSVSVNMPQNDTQEETVTVSNISTGNSTLDYEIELTNNTFPENVSARLVLVNKNLATDAGTKDAPVEVKGGSFKGFGGPDLFGYEWIDSDEPNGPEYVWEDISSTGTAVTDWAPTGTFDPLDEGKAGPYDLGFDFKFYGEVQTSVYFSSNGFITFNDFNENTYSNDDIPNSDVPNNMIAGFWDDMDGDEGTVYYKAEANRFIVQFTNWKKYFGTGAITFQYVLNKNGKIQVYYNSVDLDVTSATIGIENNGGDDGLQVSYNSSYVTAEKALQISAEPDWLAIGNQGGTLYNGQQVAVILELNSDGLEEGQYSMDMEITSNDPNNPMIVVPVSMQVGQGGPEGYIVDVNVMDAGGMKNGLDMSFGCDANATDGIDSDLGEFELPPVPPAGVFDSRFVLPGNIASLADIRPLGQDEVTWTLQFQTGTDGYPVTISWDNTVLPEGSFYLQDPFGGSIVNVDMKSTDMYEVTNSSITSLLIVYSEMMNVEMTISQGWNILSVPVHAPDMGVSVLFPDAVSPAYGFDNGYTTMEELAMGAGYWLKFDDGGTHMMTGMPDHINIALNEGWNIVGPFETMVNADEIVTNPAGIIASVFYGYDNGYSIADELYPGEGYWVKASADGEMVMMPVAKKGNDTEMESPNADALYTISVATADGAAGSYGLMLGIDPAATDGIDSDLGETELPPLPPAGVYDARMILPDGTTGSPADYRTGDNNYTGQVTYTLKYQLGDGGTSMTLDVDIPEIPGTVTMTVQDPFGGVLVNEVVNEGGGQVVVTNTSLTELKLIVDYNAPIPVELSSFAANVVGETIQLAWETATETNNKGFEVERSEDGESFTKVGYMDGNGTTSEKQSYTFTDHHAVSGTYYYRLRQVDFDGTSSYSDAVEVDFVPTEYSLGQNYPNPFNPSTRIKFAVPVDSKVTVTLYNMLGQKVKDVVSRSYSVGLHKVDFNAGELSSGMYIYSITALGVDGSNFVDTKKMMLMK